jgi:hypothetical protein
MKEVGSNHWLLKQSNSALLQVRVQFKGSDWSNSSLELRRGPGRTGNLVEAERIESHLDKSPAPLPKRRS